MFTHRWRRLKKRHSIWLWIVEQKNHHVHDMSFVADLRHIRSAAVALQITMILCMFAKD
jgi:hypothetical protein